MNVGIQSTYPANRKDSSPFSLLRASDGLVRIGVYKSFALVGFLALLFPLAMIVGAVAFWACMTFGAALTALVMRFGPGETLHRVDVEQLISHVRPGRKLAILDPQTALLQRWYFDLRLAEESERCRRHGFKMSVVFIQVDPPDDASVVAHETPDDRAAQLFIRTIRKGDLAAKIDPRTYAVCLMHSNEGQARAAIRRLMGIQQEAVPDILVAMCPDEGSEVASLLAAAHTVDLNEPILLQSRLQAGSKTQPLARLLVSETSGKVELKPGETASQAKSRVRRAARRAGIEIEVWEEAGALQFERTDSPQTSVVHVA